MPAMAVGRETPLTTRLPAAAPAARGWAGLWRRALAGLVQPRTLVGVGAGLTILILLLSVADWRQVLALISRVGPGLLALLAGLQLIGFGCRAARWLVMVRASGLVVQWRRALAAYFGSEVLGPLPASPLFASYLLHRGGDAPVWSTVPVVCAGLLVDILVVVAGTALVPEGAPPPVRVAAALLCAAALLVPLLVHWPLAHRLADSGAQALIAAGRSSWPGGERWWRPMAALPRWLRQDAAPAFGPQSLLPAIVLTAIPVVLGATGTALLAAALGFPEVTAARAWAASGTMMALSLASPLPFDLGVTEGAGMLAYGWQALPPSAALAMGLVGRVWGTTIGLTLAGLATWLLRSELR